MKKNNKGFFLVEAIVVITLVTSVLAFVYPSLAPIYETFNDQARFYDQPEDLYALRALYEANKDDINKKTKGCPNKVVVCTEEQYGCLYIDTLKNLTINNKLGFTSIDGSTDENTTGIELYIVDYVAEPTNTDKEFNKYLHNLKKTSWDKDSYRLIGKFKKNSSSSPNTNPVRYASIKIYNPNSNSFCEGKY